MSNENSQTKNQLVLWVDDEPQVVNSFQRALRGRYTIVSARSGPAGLEKLRGKERFSVIVTDMNMPEMDGIEFLKRAHEIRPEIVCLMLTGNQDQQTAVRATNEGAVFRFLNKPVSIEEIAESLADAITEHGIQKAKKDLLDKTLGGCMRVLADVIRIVDPVNFTDSVKSRTLIIQLGKSMQLQNIPTLILSNTLAGIGVVSIPTNYIVKLHSGDPLTNAEQILFNRIPSISETMLAHVPRLEEVRMIVKYLGKNFDGTGYPDERIRGLDIPWNSRFLRIVKDLSAIQDEDTPWSKSIEELRKQVGWYDPELLDRIEKILNETETRIEEASCGNPADQLIQLTVNELQVGHRIISNIETKDGLRLLSAGEIISPVFLERVKNYAELVGINEPIFVASLEPVTETDI